MSEDEMNQCNCQECACEKKRTTKPYDILAIIFCICPVLVMLFSIDYHNATTIVQTAGKAILLLIFPLVISIIGIKDTERENHTSHIANTVVCMIFIIYAVLLLIGLLDGGKLFG